MQIMTRERYEHLKRDPKRKDEVRDIYHPMQVWAPQITQAERKEREQQVANGILPF
jgi:hypothetical protein